MAYNKNPLTARLTKSYRETGRVDYQMVACPQRGDVCGDKTVFSWDAPAGSNDAFTNITVRNFDFTEKCSYVIKTADGAPGFIIQRKTFLAELWMQLHYIEYDQTYMLETLGDYKDYIMGIATPNKNDPKGRFYDPDLFIGQSLPWV